MATADKWDVIGERSSRSNTLQTGGSDLKIDRISASEDSSKEKTVVFDSQDHTLAYSITDKENGRSESTMRTYPETVQSDIPHKAWQPKTNRSSDKWVLEPYEDTKVIDMNIRIRRNGLLARLGKNGFVDCKVQFSRYALVVLYSSTSDNRVDTRPFVITSLSLTAIEMSYKRKNVRWYGHTMVIVFLSPKPNGKMKEHRAEFNFDTQSDLLVFSKELSLRSQKSRKAVKDDDTFVHYDTAQAKMNELKEDIEGVGRSALMYRILNVLDLVSRETMRGVLDLILIASKKRYAYSITSNIDGKLQRAKELNVEAESIRFSNQSLQRWGKAALIVEQVGSRIVFEAFMQIKCQEVSHLSRSKLEAARGFVTSAIDFNLMEYSSFILRTRDKVVENMINRIVGSRMRFAFNKIMAAATDNGAKKMNLTLTMHRILNRLYVKEKQTSRTLFTHWKTHTLIMKKVELYLNLVSTKHHSELRTIQRWRLVATDYKERVHRFVLLMKKFEKNVLEQQIRYTMSVLYSFGLEKVSNDAAALGDEISAINRSLASSLHIVQKERAVKLLMIALAGMRANRGRWMIWRLRGWVDLYKSRLRAVHLVVGVLKSVFIANKKRNFRLLITDIKDRCLKKAVSKIDHKDAIQSSATVKLMIVLCRIYVKRLCAGYLKLPRPNNMFIDIVAEDIDEAEKGSFMLSLVDHKNKKSHIKSILTINMLTATLKVVLRRYLRGVWAHFAYNTIGRANIRDVNVILDCASFYYIPLNSRKKWGEPFEFIPRCTTFDTSDPSGFPKSYRRVWPYDRRLLLGTVLLPSYGTYCAPQNIKRVAYRRTYASIERYMSHAFNKIYSSEHESDYDSSNTSSEVSFSDIEAFMGLNKDERYPIVIKY